MVPEYRFELITLSYRYAVSWVEVFVAATRWLILLSFTG